MKIFILIIFALCSVAVIQTTEAPTTNTPIVTTDAPTKAQTTSKKTTMKTTTKTTTTIEPTTKTTEVSTTKPPTTTVTTTKTSTNKTTTKPTTTPKPTNATTTKATTTNATTTSVPTTTSKNTTTVPANTTTVPANTTTVPANTTTVPANTTTVPANTTTVPANTTTVPANTTTVPANTTTVPANTTTMPVNTTTPTPATTPSTPSTTPSPIVTFDFVDKDTNKTCIKLTGNIKVDYKFIQGNETKNGNFHFDAKAKVTGKCSDLKLNTSNSYIAITENNYVLTISFASTGKDWYLKKVDVQVGKMIHGHASYDLSSNNKYYQAPLNYSYACDTMKELDMDVTTHNITNATLSVDLQNVKMQPSGDNYDNLVQCPSNNSDTGSSSIVPIAVGCALAGLIVIVLIAYLIGRRRNSNRGYQQV